jgi:hypothetical protein
MRAATHLMPLLALTASIAACGGEDALSRADYVEQANAICRDYNAQIEKLEEPRDFAGIRAYVSRAKDLTDDAVTRLDELQPPEELAADHDAFVKEGRQVAGLADQLAAAADKRDEAALQRISEQGEKNDERSDARAERMGLTECAKD